MFSQDRSKLIRHKVAGDLSVGNCLMVEGVVLFLKEWKDRESDQEVIKALDEAIQHQNQDVEYKQLGISPLALLILSPVVMITIVFVCKWAFKLIQSMFAQ